MSISRALRNAIFGAPPPPPKVRRVRPPRPTRGVKLVKPSRKSLIAERGWRRSFNTWQGHYANKYGTWPGRIQKRGDIFEVFIKRPPPEVQNYSGRFQCFSKRSGGWWNIHLHRNPASGDPSDVLRYVEQLLHRSITRARRANRED